MDIDCSGPQNPEEPRMIDWRKALQVREALMAGDVILGFEEDTEVDIFITALGDSLCGAPWHRLLDPSADYGLNNSGRRIYRGWHGGAKAPSEVLMPPKFYGSLQNRRVVMLQDSSGSEEDYRGRRTLRVGIFADMHSSGRGVVGRVAKVCDIATTVPTGGRPGNTGLPLIATKYKNIRETHNAEKAAVELNLEAARTATLIIMAGLRSVYSGGLPGSGKRS